MPTPCGKKEGLQPSAPRDVQEGAAAAFFGQPADSTLRQPRSPMRELLLALVAGACCAAPALAQRDAEFTAPREATASTAGARRIVVAAGAGSLRIEGKRGLTEVRARGTAWASSRRVLDEIKLVATRRGDVVELRTDIPEHEGRNWDDFQAGIDLVVEVPDSLALDVEDGSGSLEIRNVGALDVRDGSGEMTIEHVGGSLTIRDGSGTVRVDDVRGAVEIPADGSGTLEIRRVAGSVRIDSKGSGSVDVDDVAGSFTVRSKGSGSVTYRNVQGAVQVPERRSGRRYRER